MGINQDASACKCDHDHGRDTAELYRQLRYCGLNGATILLLMDAATGVSEKVPPVTFPVDPKPKATEPEVDFSAEATNTPPPEDHTYLPEDPDVGTDVTDEHIRDAEKEEQLQADQREQEKTLDEEKTQEQEPLDPHKSYTRDDIRNAMRPLVAISRDKAKEILEKYGAGNISDLAEEHFPVVMVELTNATKA